MAHNYKNAFNCKHCPQTDNENGCPVWWKVTYTNAIGEQRIDEKCGFQHMPAFFIEVIKAANRPAAVIESMRNETVHALMDGFTKICQGITEGTKILTDIDDNSQLKLRLENKETE